MMERIVAWPASAVPGAFLLFVESQNAPGFCLDAFS
jgi:hypothetical protein